MGNQPSSCSSSTEISTNNKVVAAASASQSTRKDASLSSSSLLWGCATAEEHHAKMEHVLSILKKQKNDDPVVVEAVARNRLLSCELEYRLVHTVPCHCNESNNDDDDMLSNGDDDDDQSNFDFINDDDDDDGGEETFMVPIGVPLHKSLSSHLLIVSEEADEQEQKKSTMTHSTSNLSLFSLATHLSTTSSQRNQENRNDNHDIHYDHEIPQYCAVRLVHVPTDTPLNVHNHNHYIASGLMYDAITDLCTRAAHEYMNDILPLEKVAIHLPNNNNNNNSNEIQTCTALVHRRRQQQPQQPQTRRIFIIMTGKGQVRAGIFSRRLLLTQGLEAATAISFLHEAITNTRHNNHHQKEQQDDNQEDKTQLKMDEIWMLDPNALGEQNALSVVAASLDHIIACQQNDHQPDTNVSNAAQDQPPPPTPYQIYVLAHSMAGSQLVRHLHAQIKQQNDTRLFQSIQAIAFTDSNHNIQWTKDTPELYEFLQGDACLYIKSISKHEHAATTSSTKSVHSRQQQSTPSPPQYPLGKVYHGCSFWKHRFGTIRTIYAGTREHALTNYAARHFIWKHFDHCYHQHCTTGSLCRDQEIKSTESTNRVGVDNAPFCIN